MDPRPIGVFDSGVGGLTVARALRAALPRESILYLGDTARLPYGTKTAETVARYARQAAMALVERDVKLLVIACNTASAVALDGLRRAFAPLPLVGVVKPGAVAAVESSASGLIGVIGTEGTIRGGAYDAAIRQLRPGATVVSRACPLFVGLAEEGWTDGAVPREVARRYLEPILAEGPDTLVLGCTHFPVLRDAIAQVVGAGVRLVDSAETTARWVQARVRDRGLGAGPGSGSRIRFLATDGRDRFVRVGARFLGEAIEGEFVELVDL